MGSELLLVFLDSNGTLLKVVGGKKLGFKDGNLENAEFNNPQGLVFLNKNVLYVADTENHAIRKIDLLNNNVETVAGKSYLGLTSFIHIITTTNRRCTYS